MADISTVTTWILNGEVTIEEGDMVDIVTKSGEVVKGEVVLLSELNINIDSEQLGDVYIDLCHIEELSK